MHVVRMGEEERMHTAWEGSGQLLSAIAGDVESHFLRLLDVG